MVAVCNIRKLKAEIGGHDTDSTDYQGAAGRGGVSDGRSVKRNTWERMYRIYGWLKNGEYPNCGRVVAGFEVERKTALRDIAFMQDRMEMPIAYDDKRHGVQQRPLRLAGTSVAAPEPRRTLAGHSP
jgi:hypothetical protein